MGQLPSFWESNMAGNGKCPTSMEDFPIAMLDYWRVMGIEATSRGRMEYHGNQGNNGNFDERTMDMGMSENGYLKWQFSKRESDDSTGKTSTFEGKVRKIWLKEMVEQMVTMSSSKPFTQ